MTRAVDAVIDFLEAEQARGVTHVLLDEEAREGLRKIYRAAARPCARPSTPAPDAGVPASRPAALPPAVQATLAVSTDGTKAERLAALRAQASNWQPARALGTLRETMVFATGNPDARLMLVGEAPGHEEERRQEPFVGPAGQKLNDILKAMGLTREDVYISNIVKFRPATQRQTTNNRPPSPAEIACCLPFIQQEAIIVRPHCIVALGDSAAAGLLGLDGTARSMRGTWYKFNEIPVRVTYHPSHLLRSERDLTTKRQLWEDMLSIMELLKMPISEKQRAFFLPKMND
jgi:uracil-DNA glycosylase family 4